VNKIQPKFDQQRAREAKVDSPDSVPNPNYFELSK
jgi:hypothetical protein